MGRGGDRGATPPGGRAAARSAVPRGDAEGDKSVAYGERTVRRHPHAARRAEILAAHPEVRRLFGRNPWTAGLIAVLAVLQVASAVWLTRVLPAPAWLAAAWAVGAVVDHALFVLSHDAAHGLVCRGAAGNRAVMVAGNVPHVVPSAMFFYYYHKLHHSELKTGNDPEHPFPAEARLVGTSPAMKALWLALFFLVQSLRTAFYTYRVPRGKDSAWIAVNFAVNATFNAAIYSAYGARPLLYLLASVIFSLGLHPLGARWIQEHYPTTPYQATYSYYGAANAVAFNIGHHVEHHDFSGVPWNRLPSVRAAAPEYYDTLHSYSCYTSLLLRFIFDRAWSIGDRIDVEQDYADAVAAGAVAAVDPFTHAQTHAVAHAAARRG